MADDKDKGPAEEPDLSAGDPEGQSRPDDETPESDAEVADTAEPSNEELAAETGRKDSDGDDPVGDDSDKGDPDKELVAVGAAAKTRSESSGGRSSAGGAKGREKKTEATPKQHKGTDRPRRTGPIAFVKESVAELRKVVYPTGPQLLRYFLVVLAFVAFIITIVSLLDLGFGALIFWIFGN